MTRRALFGSAAAASLGALALVIGLVLRPLEPPAFEQVRAGFLPSEAYLTDRHGEILDSVRVDFRLRRLAWVPLRDVSPALIAALVDGEDRRFWAHGGVDWLGAAGALRDDLLFGRRRGASTITMQLAWLLDRADRPGAAQRGAADKIRQVRLALGLERHWSKPQVLEAYLNLLQYRGELQGIGAAARFLAAKAPSGLSLPESDVLAALLPNPSASAPRVAARACARASHAPARLDCAALGTVARSLLARAATAPDPDALAPQLASALLKHPGERVQTTLDARVQRIARDALRRQLAGLAALNVRDGAAIVVDNDSGDVLAYVGSAGPRSHAAAVDGVRARRQAGSTLKPFLYGLAIERRYLTAASLLDDSPLNIDTASGVYLPQDYDHDFKGPVSVRTALGGSLNVPAVRTLVLVGVEALRGRLQALGYAGISEDGEYYGYSLALGSAEVSLWEQAQAYRALARGGEWSPLRLRAGDARAAAGRVFPLASAFVIGDVLSDRAARAVTFGLDNALTTGYWSAVKTGTSKDMRDNWCVGYTARYTVAVWVGNFEGDPMHDVSGVTGAAPAWRDIVDALRRDGDPPAPVAPAGVLSAPIRFASGVEPPRQEWFLAGTVPAGAIDAVTHESRIARIRSPANGMVIAIDPDIPLDRQRVPITIQGGSAGLVLRLNDQVIARSDHPLLWRPQPGAQRLALEDRSGRILDRILFTVR